MKRFFLIALSLFAFLNLLLWPKNKYEWMEGEVTGLPEDGNATFYIVFALLPIIVLAGFALFLQGKKEKIIFLSISTFAAVLWAFKFLF